MPLAPPSSLSRVSSAAGDSASPSTRRHRRCRNSISTYVGLVRRLLGRDRAAVDEFLRLMPGILQHLALGGDVQEVGVDRERRLAALVLGDRDLVLLGIFDEPGARGQLPFAPGRDHLDVGLERVIGELEAHLVVALAGRAMGDGIGAGLGAISIWRLAISGRAIEVPRR